MKPSSSKRRKMQNGGDDDDDGARVSVEQIVRQFSALSNRSSSPKGSNSSSAGSDILKSPQRSETDSNKGGRETGSRSHWSTKFVDFGDIKPSDVFSRRHLIRRIIDADVVDDADASLENVRRAKPLDRNLSKSNLRS